MTAFLLPDLGEGLAEAEVVSWHVGPGDHVTVDQPLVSVETAKAVVEIPSPRAGTIARLLAKEGDMVPVGGPLLEFAEAASAPSAAIVGEIVEAPSTAAPAPRPVPPKPAAGAVRAAPAVRRLAQERGVDLSAIRPSGRHGEFTREDVLAAAGGVADWQPLKGARRTMAEVMARAGASVVPATVMDEVEVSSWRADAPVTLLVARAMVAACRTEPALNAAFDPEGPRRLLRASVDIGVAVDVPDGLLVPIVRGAETLAPDALDAELGRVIDLARGRKAQPDLYRDPSITLSNFGSLGGRHAMLVVVPPQVAILGAGRIFERDGEPHRRYLPLSLTFDHRAVTGGEAARFLQAVVETLRGA